MNTTLTAHFDQPSRAQRACDQLQAAGIPAQALHMDEAPGGKAVLTVAVDDEARAGEITSLLEDCAGTVEHQAGEPTSRAEYDSLRAPVWHG